MKWICVREFGLHKPGSVVDLPDGASVDPEHWEPWKPFGGTPPTSTPATPAVTPASAVNPKEGM